MNYILSALGLAGAANRGTAPSSRQDERTLQTRAATCRPWSRPDPAVRLRLQDNAVIRIFGYPEQEDMPPGLMVPPMNIGNGGMPMLHLRGNVPAYVDYIMGDDWRSRLRSDHETSSGRIFKTGKVILREDERESDELGHCLRMRRCGAIAIRSEVDVILDETAHGLPSPGLIFGWPAEGGVWMLRELPADYNELDAPFPCNPEESAALDEMQERFCKAAASLKRQDDMEGICRVIEQAGGEFYPNIGDCPEALPLMLL